MRPPVAAVSRRLYGLAALIVLIGGPVALTVYWHAPDPTVATAASYQIVGGHAYAVPSADDARQAQQLERLGGKASVWAVQFNRWLGSLWSGRRLAATLTVLTVLSALVCCWAARLCAEEVDDPEPTRARAPPG